MKLGHFLTAMFVVYLLSILFGCWLNLKESRKEGLREAIKLIKK